MNAWLEARVGPRLRAVASFVEGRTVADIGSDHGLLPAWLLRSGRVLRVIVVEKHEGPFERAVNALARVNAEVRRGDGLEPLAPNEVDCLSMSGFGAAAMVAILEAFPERVPARVVAQPNHSPELLRTWAERAHYKLIAECQVEEGRQYSILVMEEEAGHGGSCASGSQVKMEVNNREASSNTPHRSSAPRGQLASGRSDAGGLGLPDLSLHLFQRGGVADEAVPEPASGPAPA